MNELTFVCSDTVRLELSVRSDAVFKKGKKTLSHISSK